PRSSRPATRPSSGVCTDEGRRAAHTSPARARDEQLDAATRGPKERVLLARARRKDLGKEMTLLCLLTDELLAQGEARSWRHVLEALALIIRAVGTAARLEWESDSEAILRRLDDLLASVGAQLAPEPPES
ncbi:MAG: hypothetical protein C4290_11335, partial [Chloroflexota bacterium]